MKKEMFTGKDNMESTKVFDTVVRLIKPFIEDEFTLYADNYYSSEQLAEWLL